MSQSRPLPVEANAFVEDVANHLHSSLESYGLRVYADYNGEQMKTRDKCVVVHMEPWAPVGGVPASNYTRRGVLQVWVLSSATYPLAEVSAVRDALWELFRFVYSDEWALCQVLLVLDWEMGAEQVDTDGVYYKVLIETEIVVQL